MEQYQVKPLTDFLPVYKDKHRIIVRAIEDSTLPIEEKLKLYELEVGKLKTQFSSDRKAEYESKSVELSVSHSCTSDSSGSKKNCGYKCVTAPVEGLYTIKEWTRVEGDNKGVSISANQACLKMTVSGRGRNAGTLFAIFKYEPIFISTTTEKETISLFNLIISVVDTSEFVDERKGNHIVFEEASEE